MTFCVNFALVVLLILKIPGTPRESQGYNVEVSLNFLPGVTGTNSMTTRQSFEVKQPSISLQKDSGKRSPLNFQTEYFKERIEKVELKTEAEDSNSFVVIKKNESNFNDDVDCYVEEGADDSFAINFTSDSLENKFDFDTSNLLDMTTSGEEARLKVKQFVEFMIEDKNEDDYDLPDMNQVCIEKI